MLPKTGSTLCRAIDQCLRLVTLGGQSRFMTQYHTVLGERLYLAPTWDSMSDSQRYILLRHERIHLRQRRRWGSFLMTYLYIFPIFPLGFALGRARIEWEAYEETLRATAEVYGPQSLRDSGLKECIIARFTGPDYGYMWPFPNQVARWYEAALAKIQAQAISCNPHDSKDEGHS